MGMTISITAEEGGLKVFATGTFTLASAKKTFLDIIDAVLAQRISNVLFDGQTLKGEPEAIERFYYGKFTAETSFRFLYSQGIVPRFAYVLKEPVLDPKRFGETTAKNRGMVVKVFDDLDDACKWLRELSGDRADTR